MKLIICKGCGEEKKHWAKGMCQPCYDRKRRATSEFKRDRRESRRKRYATDPEYRERCLNRADNYYNRNREVVLERLRGKYAESPEIQEKMRRRSKKYQEENPERVRVWHLRSAQRRRAKVMNLPYTLTPQDWQEILDCWDYRCAYCGNHDFNLEQEHVTPVSQEGGYTIENIVPACRSCNAKKGGRTPIEAGMRLWRNH